MPTGFCIAVSLPGEQAERRPRRVCGRRALIVRRFPLSSTQRDLRHHSATSAAGRMPSLQEARAASPAAERRLYTVSMPDEAPKRLIVVGDRVLIAPEEGEERINVGLYLPATALEGRQVQGGRIIATGPGTPMTEPASMDLPGLVVHAGRFRTGHPHDGTGQHGRRALEDPRPRRQVPSDAGGGRRLRALLP